MQKSVKMPLGRGKNKCNDHGGKNELDLVKATVTRVKQASSRALGDNVGKKDRIQLFGHFDQDNHVI